MVQEQQNYEALIEEIVSKATQGIAPAQVQLSPPQEHPADKWEARLAKPMFWLSLVSLVLVGLATSPPLGFAFEKWFWVNTYWTAFWLIYPIFIAELFWIYRLGGLARLENDEKMAYIVYSLIPPLRMGRRHCGDYELIEIPVLNWCKANDALFDRLKLFFSTPMILIALVIVPILIIDWKFTEQVSVYVPQIERIMRITETTIWIIFSYEFIIMFSVTDEKLDYCKKNWIDLVIILLPLMAALLPPMTFLRVLRLNQLARAYRLKGVFSKVRQALILADSVQKILFPRPEKQLLHLQKRLRENRREKEELERQVAVAIKRYQKYQEKQALKAAKKNKDNKKS